MTEQEMINEAYIKALAAVERANEAGKQCIGLRPHRRDGYRLSAVRHSFGGQTSYCFDKLPTDWAQNVVYRLRECCLLPVDVDEIDEYFDKLGGS